MAQSMMRKLLLISLFWGVFPLFSQAEVGHGSALALDQLHWHETIMGDTIDPWSTVQVGADGLTLGLGPGQATMSFSPNSNFQYGPIGPHGAVVMVRGGSGFIDHPKDTPAIVVLISGIPFTLYGARFGWTIDGAGVTIDLLSIDSRVLGPEDEILRGQERFVTSGQVPSAGLRKLWSDSFELAIQSLAQGELDWEKDQWLELLGYLAMSEQTLPVGIGDPFDSLEPDSMARNREILRYSLQSVY